MKKFFFIIVFILFSFAIAQAPPPPSMPSEDSKVLIDELIKVTEYESYFTNYCKNKIEQIAKKNNWNEKTKEDILKSINFQQFTNTIYNVFARNSKEDLEESIQLLSKLNKKRSLINSKLVISNLMMQNNLEGYVKALLKGDYIE